MILRDKLDDKIHDTLATALSIEVGLSDVPSETPSTPYIILEHSPSPGPEGSMADPEDMPYLDYLVKSVGRNHKETSRTASRVRGVMTGMNGAGWTYSFDVTGITVVSRQTISFGMVIKAPSPELFEVNDIYRICVSG